MNRTIARIRAAIGGAFAIVGLVIMIQLILKPAPPNQKLMGIAFAAVLVALGVVRVRAYLLNRPGAQR
jgi:hypothetical protein